MKKGFTLIELLVVVTIIALLTAIGMVTYASAQRRSRDGKRKADLETIRSALEMYRVDNVDGEYPDTNYSGLSTALSGYINVMPLDPKTYNYEYDSGAPFTTYCLCAYLESGLGSTPCSCSGNCGSTACNYSVQNP